MTWSLGATVKNEMTVVVAGSALFLASGPSDYLVYIAILMMAYGIAAIGMNMLLGFAGILSVGHAGFMAIGAYTWALSIPEIGAGGAFALVVLTSFVSGGLVGLLVLRFSSYYLAVVTLAFGLFIEGAIELFPDLTGGSGGIRNVGYFAIGGFSRHDSVFMVGLLLVLLALALQRGVRFSGVGISLLAIRGNPVAAESLGVPIKMLEIGTFTVSAVLAGIGGCLVAQIVSYVSPSQFGFSQSVLLLVIPLLGGRGYLAAPLIGVVIAVALPEYTRFLGNWRLAAYGAILVLIAVFAPNGAMQLLRGRRSLA
jgi:ABC-type branched-subunit amino acid transport system permease subunit